ncbi:CAP domain-containing protein, partial [Cellulomonas massiliensis]|uniref:CAP domain-containing protein n=1 Tax=Cellulomonas massiliensis TaxID=1465811 RepID=UPI000371EA86
MSLFTRSPSRARFAPLLTAAAALTTLALVLLAPPARAAADDAAQIAELVASARQDAGRAPLARNAALDDVAAAWARRMADEHRMYHNPELASQVPGGWRSLGENVANGYRDAASVHDGWMHSPGHRANILGEGYTDIGIAFLRAGGTTWGVEVFATYPEGSAGAAARRPVEPAPETTGPQEPEPAATADARERSTASAAPRQRASRAAERTRRTATA